MPRLPLVAAALLALPAAAQEDRQFSFTTEPEHTCLLLSEPHEHRAAGTPTPAELDARVAAWRAEANPTSETVVTTGSSSTFVVTYTGFEPYPAAQAAYQAAVDVWAEHLSSVVPIVVTAEFAPLGTNVLGSAGPFLVRNFAGAPLTNVWYPYATADAIAGVDVVPGVRDLQSRFSSNFTNWYFGTDGAPPAGQFDFRSVVLHELGHGLGFSGSGRWDDGVTAGRCDGVFNTGCWGRNGYTTPQVFDLFVESFAGVAMLDTAAYANPSVELGALVRSNSLWVDSPRVVAVPGTPFPRGRLWAPGTWQQGSSFSHWHEQDYPTGSTNAMMTPQVAPGESFAGPGALTCAFFADMGWPLGPGCAQLVAEEDGPAATAAALRLAGPNPVATTTRVRLALGAPQAVRAALYDATGRRVRALFEGDAPAGELTLTVDARGLAAGVYAVRATVDGRTEQLRIVVAR